MKMSIFPHARGAPPSVPLPSVTPLGCQKPSKNLMFSSIDFLEVLASQNGGIWVQNGIPKSINKPIPKHTCNKRYCWERFFLKFGVLRPSKTSFSLQRGAKNHMFTKFSLFFRIIPQSYKKPLKMEPEILPKHPQICHPKTIEIFIKICNLFDPPKWSKMEPLGNLKGCPGGSLGRHDLT